MATLLGMVKGGGALLKPAAVLHLVQISR